MTTLGTLPNELAAAIAKQVHPADRYACSLINRQFHAVANPLLWHSLNIKTTKLFNKLIAGLKAAKAANAKAAGGTTTDSFSPLGSLIRHVHLDSFLTDKQFLKFMKHARLVEELIMHKAVNITDASTRHLPLYCHNLKYLNMNHSRITQRSIQALGGCHQLSKLFLISCPGLNTDAFHALAACPLDNMMAYACGMGNPGDDVGFPLPGQRTLHQAVLDLVAFNHLTSLALLHCPPDFVERLFTTLVNSTRSIWPQLTKLSLNGCKTLPEIKAINFIRAHPRLTVFAVEPNSFTDLFLEVVGSNLHGIESLGVSGTRHITPHGVRKLIKHCPALEQVRLYECDMTIHDFPEAGYACLDEDGYFVNLLDEEAIMEIELLGFTSDEDDDSGEDDVGDGD